MSRRQGPRWTRPLQVLRCSSVIDLDSEVAMEEDSPSDRSDLSDPAPFDSPPHRRQKVERFWQKEIAAVNSMIEDLLTSEQPQFATCHSLAEWYTSEVAAANQYIEDLLTPTETATCESLDQWRAAEVEATNEYIADLLTPSAPHPVPVAAGMVVETEEDAISDFDDAAASSVAVARAVLYPHLHRHSQSRLWGSILMRCTFFKSRSSDGKPECWYNRMPSSQEREKFPKAILREQAQIRQDVSWQLRNPR